MFDIGIPRLSGYDLVRRLRAAPSMRDVFMVAVTGLGQGGIAGAPGSPASTVTPVKPVEPDELIALLSACLARNSRTAASS